MKPLFTLIALALSASSSSQTPEILSIRKYREENTAAIMKEYVAFLSIPNTANDVAGLKSNTEFIIRITMDNPLTLRNGPKDYNPFSQSYIPMLLTRTENPFHSLRIIKASYPITAFMPEAHRMTKLALPPF